MSETMERCQKCDELGATGRHAYSTEGSIACGIRQQRGREIAQELRAMDIQSVSNCDAGDRVVRAIESKIAALIEKLEGDT